jgi:GTP cyclohydrolase II
MQVSTEVPRPPPCGPQLDAALRRFAEEGMGVVVYLRGHERS